MKNTNSYMKKNWVRAVALAMAVLMLPVFVSCKQSKVQDEAPLVLPTPVPEPKPVSGGELRLPMPTNVNISDPYLVNTEEMLTLYSLVYEGLLRIDNTGKLTASLAETWASDPSGSVWTLSLRSAARWQDNKQRVTAADVKYSYDRIVGMGGISYYSQMINKIESVSVVDDSTVSIAMKEKGISPIYALTFPILRADSSALTLSAGTGPYKVESATSASISLKANDSWWKQKPYIDSIVFLARDNNETALASYEAGQLNMVPTSTVSAGKYRDEGVTYVLDMLTQTAEMLIINQSNEKLRDVNVRKAIAYALDRSEIIANIYMNRAQACDVPIAPDSWIYDGTSKVYDYDQDKAIALMKEAGWSDVDSDGKLERDGRYYDEFMLTLLVSSSTDTTRMEAAQMIADQLLKLGITVEIKTANYTLGSSENELLTALAEGKFDIALLGFNLGRDANLASIIYRDGERNYGKITNAHLEDLVAAVNTATDEQTYMKAAAQLQQALINEMPFIMLYFRQNSIVYSSAIKGLSDVREPDIFRTVSKWYINTDAKAQ
ncbi:MAG: peptide ABC transporter substrate-binding protein [Clostridia bacterium]